MAIASALARCAELSRRNTALAATTFAVSPAAIAKDLTIGLAASTASMDPQFYVVGPNSAMARNIFDELRQSGRQSADPSRARRLLEDARRRTTWEFKLRDNVKFHDGSAFTAEDVVASIKRVPLASKNSPSSFAAYVKAITDVSVVDPLTVRIKTDGPTPLLLNNLSRIAMLPAEMEKTTTEEMNTGKGVIGTGPFKFVSWSPDDNVVLARNDAYWGDKAAWDKVTFPRLPEPERPRRGDPVRRRRHDREHPDRRYAQDAGVRQAEGRQHRRQPRHVSAHGPGPDRIAVRQGAGPARTRS